MDNHEPEPKVDMISTSGQKKEESRFELSRKLLKMAASANESSLLYKAVVQRLAYPA